MTGLVVAAILFLSSIILGARRNVPRCRILHDLGELGTLTYIAGAADEERARLDAGLAMAIARGYLYAARCTWFQGLVAFGQGRLGDAQAHYEDTISAFNESDGRPAETSVLSSISTSAKTADDLASVARPAILLTGTPKPSIQRRSKFHFLHFVRCRNMLRATRPSVAPHR